MKNKQNVKRFLSMDKLEKDLCSEREPRICDCPYIGGFALLAVDQRRACGL